MIGLGAIGAEVANTAAALGMEVYGYDPYISTSINAAWALSWMLNISLPWIPIYQERGLYYGSCTVVRHPQGMITGQTIGQMKDGVVVLNFARDLLVDDDAMAAALRPEKSAAM